MTTPQTATASGCINEGEFGEPACQECIKKDRTCVVRAPGKEDVYVRPAVEPFNHIKESYSTASGRRVLHEKPKREYLP